MLDKSIRRVNNATIELMTNEQNVEIETSTIEEADVLTIETDNILLANIPNFIPGEPYLKKYWHDMTEFPSGTACRSFFKLLTGFIILTVAPNFTE